MILRNSSTKGPTAARRSATRRSGAAVVEFAVIAPFLAMLLIGLWEVGRMVEVQQILANACREAGRQASTGIRTSTEVKQIVVTYLAQYGITATTSDVTVTNLTTSTNAPNGATQLDQFRVSVTIPFSSVRWVVLNQITSTTSLSASADWYSMVDIPITVSSTIPTT